MAFPCGKKHDSLYPFAKRSSFALLLLSLYYIIIILMMMMIFFPLSVHGSILIILDLCFIHYFVAVGFSALLIEYTGTKMKLIKGERKREINFIFTRFVSISLVLVCTYSN